MKKVFFSVLKKEKLKYLGKRIVYNYNNLLIIIVNNNII